MITIRFSGRVPSPRTIEIGQETDSNADKLRFLLPQVGSGQAATLQMIFPDGTADAINITDGMITLPASALDQAGRIRAWVEILAENTVAWHSELFYLDVGELPVFSEAVEQQYPTAFQDTMAQTTENRRKAEAWAVGQRDGADVESTDESYQNNAKYYSQQGAASAAAAAASAAAVAESEAAAAASAENAAASEAAAAASESNAAASEMAAETSETEAAGSAAAALASETAAAWSASDAAESATAAAGSATEAAGSATNAAGSATAAAGSATAAAGSATVAAGSATAAASSAASAATAGAEAGTSAAEAVVSELKSAIGVLNKYAPEGKRIIDLGLEPGAVNESGEVISSTSSYVSKKLKVDDIVGCLFDIAGTLDWGYVKRCYWSQDETTYSGNLRYTQDTVITKDNTNQYYVRFVVSNNDTKKVYVIQDSDFRTQYNGTVADVNAIEDNVRELKSTSQNLSENLDDVISATMETEYTKSVVDLTQEQKIANHYIDRWGEVQPVQADYDIYMIAVKPGQKYYITADYRTAPLYGLYTDLSTISSWWPTTDQGSWQNAVDYEVTIPDGITYLAVNSGLHSLDATVKIDKPVLHRGVTLNELYGLKLVTAGDSITEGLGITDEQALDPSQRHTYGFLAKEHYNMSYLNIGLSGRTMADVSVDGVSKNGFAVERYLLVPDDTDVLTIWFGWNDYAYGYQSIRDDYAVAQYGKYYSQLTEEEKTTIPSASQCKTEFIGDINSVSTKTWGGAWNFVLNYFTVTNPIEKIGVIIPYFDVSSSGTYKTQMCELLKSICNKYGVPYIEAMKPNDVPSIGFSDPVQANASGLKAVYTADGTHPNKKGYLRIARGYIPFIARI